MTDQIPVKKNDELNVTIESLSLEGQGLARHEGFILFVPGALPRETCRIHIIKVTKSYAVAKLVEVLTPSPDRIEPICPAASSCGGCVLQHLKYESQLAVKQQAVIDALTRLGGFTDIPILPILGMENPVRYRNKASFPFGSSASGVVFGFYAEHSHRLCPVSDCPIQSKTAVDVANRVAEWANTYRIPAYDETTGKGILRHVMVRTSTSGETMAVIVTSSARLKQKEALLEMLSDLTGVWHNVNPDKTNVIFGKEFHLLAGSEAITERICGLSFEVNPQSFLQVNPVQTEKLYTAAAEMLDAKPDETVMDAYCGIGTISLLLARTAGKVFGIEYIPEAIENARRNAELNCLANTAFFCGDAAELMKKICAEHKIDALLVDPPRKGMDEPMVEAILKSGIRRMVYVSCNPATLARDCKLLCAGGFEINRVQPVDMFPHTGHIETIVLLQRENS